MPHREAGTRIEPLVSVPSEKVHQPGGHGGGRAPDEPPAMRARSCGFTRRAVVAVFGREAVGVGVHIHHPGQQPARAAQLAHREAVSGRGGALAEQLCPGKGGVAGNVEQVFYRVGPPASGGRGRFSRRRVSMLSASASMRASVTAVQAPICGVFLSAQSPPASGGQSRERSARPRPAHAGFALIIISCSLMLCTLLRSPDGHRAAAPSAGRPCLLCG